MTSDQVPAIFRLMAGLGNQMFICASAYGLSQMWNRPATMSTAWFRGRQRGKRFDSFRRDSLVERFPGIRQSFGFTEYFPRIPDQFLHKSMKLMASPLNPAYVEQRPGFDTALAQIPRKFIMGYLQSPEYFSRFRPAIQRMFALDPLSEANACERVRSLGHETKRLVMIHVRREDSLVPGNDWAGVLSMQYYGKVMETFDSSKSSFLVFSDSPDWCEEQEVFRCAHVVREPDPVLTLRMMSYCDDFIIAGSTLSWWGAWLGQSPNKRVIAPTPFFQRSSKANWRELILPDWLTMPAIWA